MTTITIPRVVSGPRGAACSACECPWGGEPSLQPDWCPAGSCVCHDRLGAASCDNCQHITTDFRTFDPGRGRPLWVVCGVCTDKWGDAA